jgi:hypothetical protein
MIIKSSLGLSFGVVFSVLLFKRRAWPAWVGLGFGAGRAWEEADGMFMPVFYDVKSPESCLAEIQSFPAASAVVLAAPQSWSGHSFPQLQSLSHDSLANPKALGIGSTPLLGALGALGVYQTRATGNSYNTDKLTDNIASFRRGDSPVRDALRR